MRSYTTLLVLSWQFAWLGAGSEVKDISATVTRQIRSLGFPEGSGMGIFFAIGIPVDIPDKSVTFSFYFEANYLLPDSTTVLESEFSEILQAKSLNRSLAYQIIETKFDGAGYPGRSCLLRTICEAKINPVTNNGLLGDIIHILLTQPRLHLIILNNRTQTKCNLGCLIQGEPRDILESTRPSRSANENLSAEINDAENAEDCNASYKDCSISILDMISHRETEDERSNVRRSNNKRMRVL